MEHSRLISSSTSTYGLTDGGKAGMIYVYIASFVGFFAAVISMAEISSMYVLLVLGLLTRLTNT